MHRITKLGVLSLAKIMGLSGAIFGLIIGVLYGGILILIGLIGATTGGPEAGGVAIVGIGGGLAMIVIIPVIYGGMSFVVGLIYGLIINFVLSLAGGLELEIHKIK